MIVRPVLFLAAALLAPPGPGPTAEPPPPAPPPTTVAPSAETPARVILRVNRNREVSGSLELEDDDVIVIRTQQGEIESFPKARLLQVVRLVEPKPGQRGAVFLRDGRIREGVIIEDTFEAVTIEVEGIRSRLGREIVDYVVLEPTIDEQYETYKAMLAPSMHDEHLQLCQWLFEQRRYQLAERELLELLERVDLFEARELLNLVRSQLALSRTTEPEPTAGDGASRPEAGDTAASGPVYESDLLPTQIVSREDVNLIRIYEIDFRKPPKIAVDPDTIRKLIEGYGTSELIPATQTGRTAMFRAEPADIVRLMFQLRARDLYPEVRVLSEPHALNLFRQRVHDTWLMNNCATSKCHGGLHAGRLFLHRRGYKDDRVRYTNLLILDRLDLGSNWPLVNYEEPAMSLIIQHGLPRDEARLPHPDVRGWRPAFRAGSDRMKRDAERWIRAMMQPRPHYPVEYDPPRLKPAPPVEAEGADSAARKPR